MLTLIEDRLEKGKEMTHGKQLGLRECDSAAKINIFAHRFEAVLVRMFVETGEIADDVIRSGCYCKGEWK